VNVIIPTINDDFSDFDRLFALWEQLNRQDLDVTFDFSGCGFLRQNAVAFLGGLVRLVQYLGGKVKIDKSTLYPDVANNLARNGFGGIFCGKPSVQPGNTIPYREDGEPDKVHLTAYLRDQWLGRGWVHVTDLLRNAIIGTVWEVYSNGFEHGESGIGIFSCGQHYPQLRTLKLTIVDFGVGIPANVRDFLGKPSIPSDQALEWAFRPGNTTKPQGMGRGLGLDILKQFIKVNKGQLEVFSHEAYALVDSSRERYLTRKSYFGGTLVNISLRCDERDYCLSSEISKEPLF
jgi:histidine kinase/DNA gyrase B/HSP90-like ATPase